MWELNELVWGVYLSLLGIYDAKHKYIKNWMLVLGGVLILWSYVSGLTGVVYLMQGAVMGAVFVMVSYITKEKIGMGDAILIGLLTMSIGIRSTIPVLLVAFFMSAIVGVGLLLVKLINRNEELAFLPYMSIGYWLCHRMNVRHKGVYTLEFAFIMPILMLIFTGIIITSFYFHDKNILYSKVYEVGTIARQMYHDPEGIDRKQLGDFLEEKCKSKLILFSNLDYEFTIEEDYITIDASMQKGQKKIEISRSYHFNDMEQVIRKVDPIE